VAGAALGDELLLARDEVLVAALDLAAGERSDDKDDVDGKLGR